MANLSVDKVLTFDATDSGSALSPSTNFTDVPMTDTVFDFNSDGNVDGVDYYIDSSAPYSGYTILLNSQRYAIFEDNFTNTYYIPYSSAIGDLSGFDGQSPSSYSITQTGDNANVSNCYLTGTLIDTPFGPRPIEHLSPGDLVRVAGGLAAPVQWVARQQIAPLACNAGLPEGRLPVCIARDALAPGVPSRDLYVSADHGMAVDGFLINAAAMVNGHSIRFVPPSEMNRGFTYWHIELEGHEVIFANGAQSESFVDYADRAAFDNYDDYLRLCGCDRIIPEMGRLRISAQRLVPGDLAARLGIGRQLPLSA